MSVELRHLRCFIAVAEELHFGRAAERLHIDPSPLSRTIRELEEDLDAQLFLRTTRHTRLTRAGEVLLDRARRLFAALEHTRACVKDVATGGHGQLHVALSDGMAPSRLATLLARCREEDPEVAIRFAEVPLSHQATGLLDHLYDLGFAQSDEVGDGILAELAWSEPLHLAVPARHPLLAYKRIPLDEVLAYPLVMGDPQCCEGYARQIERILRTSEREPLVAERVKSLDLMLAMVAAGYALAFAGASQIPASSDSGVVARPLAGRTQWLNTWLLRRDEEPTEVLSRFIARVQLLQSTAEDEASLSDADVADDART